MELTRTFSQLSKKNADLAGGKGASLGEMTQAGIPVPPGFVVLSASFEKFIHETGLVQEIDAILDGGTFNHKEVSIVEDASSRIKGLILSRDMPKDIKDDILKNFKELGAKHVAVRSSATAEDGMEHAWAGQLDSFLNTTEHDLLEKVKRCWASLFTPRAIFYRFEKGLHTTKISVAVVVQKMVESEFSGIAFSVHPVTEDYNQLIIEAGFGLGEAIVSGQVTPDSYVVEKHPRHILDINVSTQERALYRSEKVSAEHGSNEWIDVPEPKASSQVLTGKEILELSEIILGIENHYGFPCDIEWAFEKGKFYIVQSRPITTLTKKIGEIEKKNQFNAPELKDFKPEEWDYYGHWKQGLFSAVTWGDCWYPEIVSKMGLETDGTWTITMLGGHYFVKSSERKKIREQISEKILAKDNNFFVNMVNVSDDVFTAGVNVGTFLRDKQPTLENFKKFVDAARRINLVWVMGANHLTEAAEERLQDTVVVEAFPAEKILEITPPVISPLYHRHQELVELKKEVGSMSLEEIKKNKKLLAHFEKQVQKYPWVEVFNFIGEPLTVDRLYEQVTHIDIDKPKKAPLSISPEMKWRADCLNKCGYVKQAAAEYYVMFSERVLPFLGRVADKVGLTYGEMMAVTMAEIEQVLGGELAASELKKRALQRLTGYNYAFISQKDGHTLFTEDSNDIKLLKKMIPRTDENTRELKGAVGNPGKYTGPARIIMNTHDFHKMQAGDVLISTMTTPDFVILMQKAGAIVTNIGGLLCHAAIVSREINKPCVIGTKFATQIFKDGDILEVDADNGIVRILK